MADQFTFYYGAASGSCRKALRKLEEENVMINYATQNNQPWDIENLFVDSGGYSFMMGMGEYETSDDDYLDYIEDHSPTLFALRDYPCETDVLDEHDRTVRDHQRMTTGRHISLMDRIEDRGIEATPLSVIQGWSLRDYLNHIDDLRAHGVLNKDVGIGSVCRRNSEHEIREILLRVADELGPSHNLHAFGVKISVLKEPGVIDVLNSVDSQAFEFGARYDHDPCTWREIAMEYLIYRDKVRSLIERDQSTQQTTLPGVVG